MTPPEKAIERPNGKLYRPRAGLRQVGWYNEDGYSDHVAVLGTHDVEEARAFARPYRSPHLVDPKRSWIRKAIRGGEPVFAYDERRGAAAVVFRESDDPEEVSR